MVEEVIRFMPRREAQGDLERTPEFWQKCSYEERRQEIVGFIVEKQGAPPSPNMQYIREGVFKVNDNNTLDELVKLAAEVKKAVTIDCFQISIDRKRSEAHLLFDWYDKNIQNCFHLTTTHQLKLSTMILRNLSLDDQGLKDQFLRYFLMEEYLHDPEAFKKAIEWLKHSKPNRHIYRIILKSLQFAEKKSEGLVK